MVFVFLHLIYFTWHNVHKVHLHWHKCQDNLLSWLNNIPLYGYTYIYKHTHTHHNFLVRSSISGHLGCLRVLAIVNDSTLNIEVYIYFQVSVFGFFE